MVATQPWGREQNMAYRIEGKKGAERSALFFWNERNGLKIIQLCGKLTEQAGRCRIFIFFDCRFGALPVLQLKKLLI